MLTRITRYTLLVMCLLVAGIWGWSVDRQVCAFRNDDAYSVKIEYAVIEIWSPARALSTVDWFESSWVYPPTTANRLGLRLPGIYDGYRTVCTVPFWVLFAALLIPTLLVCYRPVRNRLRGKRDAGFAVEPKTTAGNERQIR